MGVVLRAVRGEPRVFAVSVGGASLVALLTVGGAFLVGKVIAGVAVPAMERGKVDAGVLAAAAAALVGLSLLKVAGIYCRRLGSMYMQLRLQASYRRRIIRRYLSLPPAWHRRNATGELLSTASSDVDAAWTPAGSVGYAMATVVLLVSALVALFLTDWALALVGVVLFPTLFGVFEAFSRRSAPRYRRSQQLRGEVSALAHESFDGAMVVKAMGREEFQTARFAVKVNELRDVLISVGRMRGICDPVVESLPTAGMLAVLVVGGWRLRSGAIDVGDLVSAAFLFAMLGAPVRAIGWLLTSLPRAVAGWDRMSAVLDATGEMTYGTGVSVAGRAAAELRFDQVTFAHDGDRPVLREVSFTVPAGATVALVGPTGSGKSSVVSLAARLIDPDLGTVRLDGADLRSLRAAALADAIGLVPQLSFVFDDTVRANVTLGRTGIDDAQVWAALRVAQAEEFVRRLADGLDTVLGERGVLLSGGQRQRLTLARAVAGRPRLLVLDDATSAVDPAVESAILAALRDGGATGSVLIVAHRPATIAAADLVVFLVDGRVAATGSHAELLATEPAYASLVTATQRAEVFS
ncbi:ABC transporter ATP-binding protein [Rhizocola hellebori]|nr:ABC transporter ATP-binding protein [Rhizocola hellebori]